ncbi:GNAT family N-acetyltransferase [Streptomyces sp. NBC_00825]|uniref:GNAT family N-acetyltransferase n=1 Tax=unclassified Streptomyces TaxID=2593676 RepID=UPI00224F8938|nr:MULTISPECIES: GNAT family N-acetyltransferase [unclassified Streptomyces]WTB51797.1 GNAT family N-acetyltransferase [Streptomyces sp. NBC_00826]WTH95311.1 GNAT family N-acetyltransferase [Streptomyces sp. NBC_00825]WTI04045.1 GNAT family N-acetyltransferase [Streptomyces sp. NBC_00822]MCX4869642.1 GNAT family N-acetyltransferase [Streptomyces sp. NBC_00906]MCX4900881.1 GNAT family N-acetyltransferase [Streptomyces sp. NBC_00892]
MGLDVTGTGTGPVTTVRRGVPAGAERRAAELYWDAFGRKLGPALNPPGKAVPFIAAHLNADRAVCALLDGQLVGLAGHQHDGRALTGGSACAVLRAYGHLRGLHRLLLLALFERHPAPGQLVMDGIAVDPDMRGRGVGSLLIEEVAAVAAEQDCREIGLDVIDTNPRARALYERRGFTAVRTEHTPYLRGLLGFGAVTTMHRPVGTKGVREL